MHQRIFQPGIAVIQHINNNWQIHAPDHQRMRLS